MDLSLDFDRAAATASFELSAYEPSQIAVSDKPEVVFSGKSNVGKSSMINRLINRKSLARVSSAPGKTASVNFYDCGLFRLVDLPGYGYAKISKQEKEHWSELVEGYFGSKRNIALVVQLIDARREPAEGDKQMLIYILQRGLPFIVALTKSDKLKKRQLEERRLKVPLELKSCVGPTVGVPVAGVPAVFTSSETSMGIDELKCRILESCR